ARPTALAPAPVAALSAALAPAPVAALSAALAAALAAAPPAARGSCRPAHGDGGARAGTAGDRGPPADRQHPPGDRLADAPAGWRGGGRGEPAAPVGDLDDRPARTAGD